MTKRGGTLRTYHPRRDAPALPANQRRAMDKANASIRRAAQQSRAAPNKLAKTKVQKRHTASKSGGGAILLVLMYLLTKKWFWIIMLLLALYGWLFV